MQGLDNSARSAYCDASQRRISTPEKTPSSLHLVSANILRISIWDAALEWIGFPHGTVKSLSPTMLERSWCDGEITEPYNPKNQTQSLIAPTEKLSELGKNTPVYKPDSISVTWKEH
ncbi:hypothetical protein STEG23_007049 [Scotinomys teguina]